VAVAATALETPTVTATAEATTPTKEKKKFFDVNKIFPKEKAKSPSTEIARPAAAETSAASEAVVETDAAKPADAAVVNGDSKATPAEPKDKRRSSFFTGDLAGSIKKFGQKAEKKVEPSKTEAAAEGEPAVTDDAQPAETNGNKAAEPKKEKDNPFSQLTRRVSTAIRGKKEAKKDGASPSRIAKTPEAEEPAEASKAAEVPKIEEPVKEAEKVEEAKPTEAPAAPQAIGDVVPEAVNIGTAPQASSTVQATA
jgi:hypothetical protein